MVTLTDGADQGGMLYVPTLSTNQKPPTEDEIKPGPIKETQSSEARDHLRLLCSVIDNNLGPQIQLRWNLGPDMSKITFGGLWYIFKPGCEVRTPGKTQIQL